MPYRPARAPTPLSRITPRTALIPLLFGLATSLSQAAVLSTQQGLNCSSTPRPTTPLDADGYGVFGDVTVNAKFMDGRVSQVDLVDGRPELLAAVREAMSRYSCETTESPRTLTMTFEFPNTYAKAAPKYPISDPRNHLVAHNSMIRERYPTRVDSIFNVEEADPRLIKLGRATQMARPELTPAATKFPGQWKVRMQMTVDTDGKVIKVQLFTDAPRAVQQTCIDAAYRMVFEPSSYDGHAYMTVVEQSFVFNID